MTVAHTTDAFGNIVDHIWVQGSMDIKDVLAANEYQTTH